MPVARCPATPQQTTGPAARRCHREPSPANPTARPTRIQPQQQRRPPRLKQLQIARQPAHLSAAGMGHGAALRQRRINGELCLGACLRTGRDSPVSSASSSSRLWLRSRRRSARSTWPLSSSTASRSTASPSRSTSAAGATGRRPGVPGSGCSRHHPRPPAVLAAGLKR